MTNNIIPFRPKSPAYRQHKASHGRALAAPMHALPFVGEPMGFSAFAGGSKAYALRRAALWACWKARRDHGLPDDLRDWNIAVGPGGTPDAAYLVSLVNANPASGWPPVTILVPAWAIAEGEGGLIIDQEPVEAPCPHTAPLALPTARKWAPELGPGWYYVEPADSHFGELARFDG